MYGFCTIAKRGAAEARDGGTGDSGHLSYIVNTKLCSFLSKDSAAWTHTVVVLNLKAFP